MLKIYKLLRYKIRRKFYYKKLNYFKLPTLIFSYFIKIKDFINK